MAKPKPDTDASPTTDTLPLAPESAAPAVAPAVVPPVPGLPPLTAAPAPVLSPTDLSTVVDRVSACVLGDLAPRMDAFFDRMREMAPAAPPAPKAPPRRAPAEPPPGEDGEDRPKPAIHDDDVDFIARALTDRQLDRIIAMRRSSTDLAYWIERGVVPGQHLVATDSIKLTVAGKPLNLTEGGHVEIAHLDEKEIEGFRAKGLLVPPGEAPIPPMSAR